MKTAYRTTYKITGGVEDTEIDNVLRYYDLSKPNVTMKNTARWRPFDWGFDEDLLNLDKGVYFIDIEGFYDDAIITGYDSKQKKNTIPEADQGKLDLNIDFYDGERKFQQRIKDKSGNLTWTKGTDINDAYLLGNVHLGYVGKNAQGQDVPTEAGLKRENPNDKYPLWLGKKGGRIYPSLDQGTKTSISTRVDISSLYSSDEMKGVPQDGLTLTNEEETYNITFSKHGRDNPDYKIDGEEVTKKRLEGAIFKLQEDNGITFEDVPGSYVASAFNGYFGFRGLKPGRYRLLEVKAPEGYVPIKDPLLYFTVETIATNSGKIIHPLTGKEVDIKSIQVKFPGNKTVYELKNLTMVDPADKTKTVAISTVDSDKIDIEKAEIIDPNDNTKKVPLKDLSIPGDKQDYKIGHTRVVEGKSGYISLEYDKANGVYQYVPEKSTTTEEGKLIDYVTSATAKNMGKIINEKPGEGEVTIKKFDQNGNELKASNLLPGAEFTLINLTNGDRKTGTIGTEGTLKFDKLQIGNYRLVETKSPDGYENNNQIWHFSIGGEGLDPYSGPIARTGVDLSDKITLQTIKASVLNPDAKTSTEITTQNNEVHPHLGESIEFENKFVLAPNTKINPGDFFTLKMSEDIDLNGIFEYEIENLDIIAPGVGTIAKADYNRNARTITYTFTDYAKTYTLVTFSNKLTAFVDLYKVKSNANKNVGFRISENDKNQYKNVNVVYDQDYGRQADHFGNTINITSKIVKYDPKTGEFLHYYYINKLKDFSYGPIEFRYESGQRIDDLKIDVAKVYNNNWQLSSTMPDSFAVNESSNNLYPFENAVRYQWLNRGYYAPVHFNDGIGRGDSYIVKVTGRVGDKDKSEYTGFGTLYKFNQGYTPTHAERHDSIRYFKNESTAETTLEIQAFNPENKITFKKVDQNGKALAGAKFRLDYLAPNSSTWSQGSERDTDKDGVLKLTKLKPGKYKLTETSAPEGYKMATNPIMEFEVDKNGKITKEVTSVDGKSTTTQDISGSTNYIVNSKTYEIEFKKVDADDNTKALEGAEFEIWYKAQESDDYSKEKLKLYQDASGNKIVLKADETAPTGYTEVEKFTTGEDGLVKFNFTEQGYYAIKEAKAPKGYIAPRDYVKEFVVKDGKVQADRYKTEMDVSKTKSWTSVNNMLNDVYATDITMKFNSDHEKITYVKDKSTITLSGLPYDNDFKAKNNLTSDGITISAKLVNKNNQSSDTKTYTLESTDYTNNEGKITINLYELVKELENKTGDSFESENTIELSMYSTLALDTTLDITSNLVIGDGEDKISEDRTFNIGTKGNEKVDHSYTFTNLGAPKLPIPIENKKSTYPLTGGNGVFTGFAIIGTAVMLTALAYFGIYQNDKNRRRSARYKK
ncbi:SpaA isopeptide-forming pilin-related protein [Anaerococcus sp. Marseille-Q7828]|uniref:SpaA isopeptide-forming pilin-related protein n=1 Tax=Anaerococcus sp. Marseille-Q7828 TaxID=3036300 RepID=UPI0024ACF1A8|nr:SpaA isopeptide-forming pilin-related protein [Anaerococcus sp. Marseille-Q7828]